MPKDRVRLLTRAEASQAMAFLVRLTPVGNVTEIIAGLVQAKRALDKGDVKGALLSLGAGPAKTAAKVTRQALKNNVSPAAAIAAGVAAGVARKTIETIREKVLKKAGVKGFQALCRKEQQQIGKFVRSEAAKAVATLGVKISDDLLSGVVNEQIQKIIGGRAEPTRE